MERTKNYKKTQNAEAVEDAEAKLSIEQLNAIDVLVTGKNDRETAETVAVARETVWKWRNENPYFQAVLNRRRREVWDSAHERLRALIPKAIDILEKAMAKDDVRAAVELLKATRIYGGVNPPTGTEDPETLLRQEAAAWVEAGKKREGTQPLDALYQMMNPQEAELTEKRLQKLRQERL